MSSKIYPIGIQNFEKIRTDGYFYIDKTALIYQMVKTGSYYFLSRPRRFGKSLLISTLEAYFLGKKELFEGLAMEKLEKDWITYPIFHIDLNTEKYDTLESLDSILNFTLEKWEQLYGTAPSETTFALRFRGLIERAYKQTGERVVILIDEYDKPMLQAIGNEELQKEFRNTMKAFYSVLKTMDGCIQFAFLTGVTKFGKVSVFSDLNNLDDISMRNQYIDICGVSEKELHDNLEIELHELADIKGGSYHEICDKLREYYDGYHFTHNSIGIYNPFSLLNTFKYKEFGSYWFETGTPTYLVELLKKHHYDLRRMAHEETSISVLNSIDSASDNPIPVIYQSGYLTIKGYDEEFGIYSLGFPNREVEEGFIKFLLPFYANTNAVESEFEIQKFVREIRIGDYDSFFRRLRSFFADTPYELIRDLELHYQNVLFIVFKLVGFYVKAEYHTSEGRIDLVLQTDKFVYVIEFKLDGTAEDALRQINEKHYALPFEAGGNRRLFKIGVNFNAKMRNIEKWIVE
ncbi:ATP-binding protein [Bacteroides ovatus]|uniref:ATP-binding protein n=1 Tax=Bacteroides ovatus TaxID=28116 RepID=UPI0020306071|nr:ATP-binding protein [Bacteroides ovatus]MCM1719231.1 ATP-binding protein [Bacteroides ovatus]MCM1756345.1 ATP-binding protein [Bacteroides ovatus]MCM1864498.1 ATP-binding protein [Bacteroides ovatus]MCM1910092.1 ATP-binding protein [Bacteroides ovatus]